MSGSSLKIGFHPERWNVIMEIKKNSRKWFWVKKIIHKFRSEREMSILHGENLIINLIEDDIVEVESDRGICLVYIPEYKESACFICG